MILLRVWAVLLLALALMGCQRASPEKLAVKAVSLMVRGEGLHLQQVGRYGSLEDLRGRDRGELAAAIEAARQADYQIELTTRNGGYVVTAKPNITQNGKPAGQRTFFADQTAGIREAQFPDIANESSMPLR
jgi:hypothetical protein